jgi:Uma2 family endonuclease
MSTAPRYIPHYTIEDYRRWEGDWELIDGVAISMTPSPFGPHERVVAELSRQFLNQIVERDCECRVYTNLDWIVSDDTVVRPDLMVVCGQQPQRHLERAPVVTVEVLSLSTQGRDLTAKRTLYRENNVAHYLVIDPDDQSILHVTENGQQPVDLCQQLTLTLDDDCEIKLDCSKLFD